MLRSTLIDETIKVSIIGFPAVGKTTMTKMLAQKETTKRYVPTAGFDLKTVEFGPYRLKIWDFGGQKNYMNKYLEDFIIGSDLIFIVTDSTPKNVLNSRELIDHAREIVEDDCPIIAIANKQDLEEARFPEVVKIQNDLPENSKIVPTSTKTGINIEESLKYLVNQIYDNYKSLIEILKDYENDLEGLREQLNKDPTEMKDFLNKLEVKRFIKLNRATKTYKVKNGLSFLV